MKKLSFYFVYSLLLSLAGSLLMTGCLEEEKRDYEAEEKAERDAFLQENDITVEPTESGLYFILIDSGSGPLAEVGDSVSIYYSGFYLTGQIFATNEEDVAIALGVQNYFTNYDPLNFILGEEGYVLEGIEEGLTYMREGSKADMIIPSNIGIVGSYTTVLYKIKLIRLVKPPF
ncbi:MAG: FKBP-type peptidyl-prolyl cis-trans isomerase [Bacteroidales bacterium]|nr:MAG: FKBP-type peptidyl-prolyl cis-trans isomerase [Bacteroidales bacterium]